MAHRLLFRSNRLVFSSLTKFQKVGSTMTHSYRQFSNKSGQPGSWNEWSHLAAGGWMAGGVLSAVYGVYKGIETYTLRSKTGRAFVAIPAIVVLGSALVAGYFGISHMFPKFLTIYRGFMVSTMFSLPVGGIIYIFWGAKYATQYLQMETFLRDPRIIQKARTAMKKTGTIAGVVDRQTLLASREKDSLDLCEAIEAIIKTDSYLIVSGMKEGGKTTLAEDAVIKLKEKGIPTVYIEVGKNDEGAFLQNCASAFGIEDEVSGVLGQKLQWDDVLKLIKKACGEQGEGEGKGKDAKGNVIIFDNVSKESPCLGKIDNLARMMGQRYRKTAVVIVASDATDVFYTRPELRRQVKTLMPINSDQIKDFLTSVLKVSKEPKLQYTDKNGKEVKQSDVARMVEMIDTSYTPSMVAIQRLVSRSQNKDKSIDFAIAKSVIVEQKGYYARKIGELCDSKETLQQLQKFVASKQGEPFGIDEWRHTFDSIYNPESIGYQLLYQNFMFYQIETGELRFHSPIVRQAISIIKY